MALAGNVTHLPASLCRVDTKSANNDELEAQDFREERLAVGQGFSDQHVEPLLPQLTDRLLVPQEAVALVQEEIEQHAGSTLAAREIFLSHDELGSFPHASQVSPKAEAGQLPYVPRPILGRVPRLMHDKLEHGSVTCIPPFCVAITKEESDVMPPPNQGCGYLSVGQVVAAIV